MDRWDLRWSSSICVRLNSPCFSSSSRSSGKTPCRDTAESPHTVSLNSININLYLSAAGSSSCDLRTQSPNSPLTLSMARPPTSANRPDMDVRAPRWRWCACRGQRSIVSSTSRSPSGPRTRIFFRSLSRFSYFLVSFLLASCSIKEHFSYPRYQVSPSTRRSVRFDSWYPSLAGTVSFVAFQQIYTPHSTYQPPSNSCWHWAITQAHDTILWQHIPSAHWPSCYGRVVWRVQSHRFWDRNWNWPISFLVSWINKLCTRSRWTICAEWMYLRPLRSW